jgi:hypothetical protein
MSGWGDLVTTALLGTDRRPVPSDLPVAWGQFTPGREAADPASTVLDLAARHRAVAQSGAPLDSWPAPTAAPDERLALAPRAAQDLLAGMLSTPEPGVVNLWLAACADRGLGAATEHWARLAALATRNALYDRALLAAVLGPRGRWFLGQNPQWAQLLSTEPPEAPAPAPRREDPGTGQIERTVRARLDIQDAFESPTTEMMKP